MSDPTQDWHILDALGNKGDKVIWSRLLDQLVTAEMVMERIAALEVDFAEHRVKCPMARNEYQRPLTVGDAARIGFGIASWIAFWAVLVIGWTVLVRP